MHFVILYGSQTGTAQDVAEQLWRSLRRWGCSGPVMAFDEYTIKHLVDQKLAIFVVATTGDGQVPDNMHKSWTFLLRRNLPPNILDGLKFACLGLGDSSYAKFNYAAKKLVKRLQQLGAKDILPLALADDQHDHGFCAVSLPWIENIVSILKSSLELNPDKCMNSTLSEEQLFKWDIEILTTPIENEMNESVHGSEEPLHLLWPYPTPYERLKLLSNQRTTHPEHFQEVRLLQFEVSSMKSSWNPGDVLQVHPKNSQEQIDSFKSLMLEHKWDFTVDTVVRIHKKHEEIMIPYYYNRPLTVLQMITYIWDLNAQPRQRVFELLALHCDNELEQEKLLEFTKMEGLNDLINYVNRPRRTILEVLHDFRYACSKLTLNILIEMFSFIQSRSFSIASCIESRTLDLLVAVVRYKTKLSKERLGLCSNWLKTLKANEEICASIKRGTMKFPTDRDTPLIMIGPGTGIALFRSIIQHRVMCDVASKANSNDSRIILFFGCRNRDKDFHFQDDLELWYEKHYINLFTAFSRDQDHKVYVQHLIQDHAKLLEDIIMKNNASIFISGSSKNMPKAVKEAFIEVVNNEQYIEQMILNKRYQEETWS